MVADDVTAAERRGGAARGRGELPRVDPALRRLHRRPGRGRPQVAGLRAAVPGARPDPDRAGDRRRPRRRGRSGCRAVWCRPALTRAPSRSGTGRAPARASARCGSPGRCRSTPASRATAPRSIAVLRRAVELGVDHIDTAAFYFSRTRSANELINAALAPYPDDLTIVTKVGPVRDVHGRWADRPGPDGLRGQVEENLRQLGRDRIDVVNFRDGDEPDIAPYVAALAELVAEGLVGHVGVSAVTLDQLEAARAVTDDRLRPEPVLRRLARGPRRAAPLRRARHRVRAVLHRLRRGPAGRAGRGARRGPGGGRRARRHAGPGAAGLDAGPGRARAGDPRHRQRRATSRRTSPRRGCGSPTSRWPD